MRAITISGKKKTEFDGEWGGTYGEGVEGGKGREKCCN